MNARPPQFGLRHLFLLITFLSVLCGAGLAWGAYPPPVGSRKGLCSVGDDAFHRRHARCCRDGAFRIVGGNSTVAPRMVAQAKMTQVTITKDRSLAKGLLR